MRRALNILSAALAVLAVSFMVAFGYFCLVEQWETAAHCVLWALVALVAALAAGKPDGLY